jgi:hypothetical protein
MADYYINEAVFALPEWRFVDRTIHRLSSSIDGVDAVSVEIRRLPFERGKSLRQLVDGEIAASRKQVNGFTVVERVEVALSGAPAILIHARLRALDVVYHQRQAQIVFEETWIALVVTGPYAERAACDEAFERIVQSLTWRSR